jgi:ATP-dependent DNA helicase UvrD/PcrA
MMTDKCLNRTEAEEREYLKHIQGKIASQLDAVSRNVNSRYTEMLDLKTYLQESKADMDHVEKASVRQSADMMSSIVEHGAAQKMRLTKLLESPYFGRIDIRNGHGEDVRPTYIGIHSLPDPDVEAYLVHDWRAPISSMFYEFELGPAHFDAPAGRTECNVLRKRQYRIEKKVLKFMLETSLNIQDEILQEELSRASDDKMKNIVATIQRDQNAIIRNDQSHTLIIQGAAGSGKTSIALHRIAFLLYKYKDSIRSDDILIVSPNKVFAHYISQVLPELGEEMIQETTMEALASELLDDKVKFQTFSEQVSILLNGSDEKYDQRIQYKATSGFLQRLEEYGRLVRSSKVNATEVKIGMLTLDAEWIDARFRMCAGRSTGEQITEVLNAIVEHMRNQRGKNVVGKERTRVRAELKRMVATTTLKSAYKDFYAWLGEPQMFKPVKGGKYEYSDVFPLIYLKMLMGGPSAMNHIKHVVIDEMQDYTPIQYQVIGNLYPCKKTILGDHNQSVSPLSSSSAETIQEILLSSECTYMHKSYRSTFQITELAQTIHRNPDLIPIERHGEKPVIIACDDAKQEVSHICQAIRAFLESDYNSLGIICKTQEQADWLYAQLEDGRDEIHLLDAHSTAFSNGVVIASAYLAKGLEFDQVVVPFCCNTEYNTVIDRHMLYVACTRAMHKLTLTHTAELSRFLKSALDRSVVS